MEEKMTPEQEKCKACNKLKNSLIIPVVVSTYILITSIYGTYKLIQLFIN